MALADFWSFFSDASLVTLVSSEQELRASRADGAASPAAG